MRILHYFWIASVWKIRPVKKRRPDEPKSVKGFNKLVFGAPGTGKSFDLQKDHPQALRTVFHSEYANADFVGMSRPSAEPRADGTSAIVYKFVPGPFAKAVVAAIEEPGNLAVLVVEEINRGNAAAIFGEILQLLDRDSDGKSTYSISIDDAFHEYLIAVLGDKAPSRNKFRIPKNLAIIGTMNSADQSVNPLDSAFKRRWNFDYKPLDFEKCSLKNEMVQYGGRSIEWKKLALALNQALLDAGFPEDRCVGPYFLHEGEHGDKERVANKLIHYLYEDVLRFEENKSCIFRVKNAVKDVELSFQSMKALFVEGQKIFSDKINIELFDSSVSEFPVKNTQKAKDSGEKAA